MDALLTDKLIQGGAVGIALATIILCSILAKYLYKIVTNHHDHDLEERKMLRHSLDAHTLAAVQQGMSMQKMADSIAELVRNSDK